MKIPSKGTPTRARLATLVLLAVITAGCGYIMAGTWEDDPKNWGRAFQSEKPGDVVVVHSKYWRSAHWTYECAYSFEIQPTEELKQQLFTQNRLRRLSTEEAATAKRSLGPAAPAWFAPGDIGRYEAWVYQDLPESNFKVFVDTQSGHLFLNDYQL